MRQQQVHAHLTKGTLKVYLGCSRKVPESAKSRIDPHSPSWYKRRKRSIAQLVRADERGKPSDTHLHEQTKWKKRACFQSLAY